MTLGPLGGVSMPMSMEPFQLCLSTQYDSLIYDRRLETTCTCNIICTEYQNVLIL
jgi:hypothetical protein